MPTVSRGAAGEILAARYLRDKGYTLLEVNYHSRFGEIDIIAEYRDFLVFVEVKTRGENALYTPVEAVTDSKQKKLIRTALAYLSQFPTDKQPRFDVVEVYMDPQFPMKAKRIVQIENAFETGDLHLAF